MLVTLLLIVRVFWDDILRSPGWWIPVPFVVLTLAQYQNTLWAFQIAWSVAARCGSGSPGTPPSTCDRRCSRWGWPLPWALWPPTPRYRVYWSGRSASSLLASRGQTRRAVILWSAAGIVAIPLYFLGFVFGGAAGTALLHQILANLPLVAKGLLISLGSVIPTLTAGILGDRLSEMIGALLFVAGIMVARGLVAGRPPGRAESVLRGPRRPDTGVRCPVGSHTDRWFDHGGDRLPIRHIQLATGGRRLRVCDSAGTRRTAPRTTGSVCFVLRLPSWWSLRSRWRRTWASSRGESPARSATQLPISWRTIGGLRCH